jgi:predicted acetyltransferase
MPCASPPEGLVRRSDRHHGQVAPHDVEVVNPVPADEIDGWARTMATTFLHDPRGPESERRVGMLARAWEPSRAWGARTDGRWVATLRTEARQLTVPGAAGDTRELEVDALTNVTVAASHRRRGLLRRMLEGSLRAARERGDALSILIAAESPIYGRYGYAPATVAADYVLRRTRFGGTVAGEPARVRPVEREEFGALAGPVFTAARRRRAGQIDRGGSWWDRTLGLGDYKVPSDLPHNWLVHHGDAGPDGLIAWTARGDTDGLLPPLGAVEIWGLIAATDEAYRNLWSYVSGIDIIEEVRIANRPIDEPVRWLLPDARTLVMTQHVDFLWLRLLDVPAALRARRYATHDELVLEVIDTDVPSLTSGRFLLQAGGDEAACSPTDRPADVELHQRALASIYLGGFTLGEMRAAGIARELRTGALARLDAMFRTPLAPWCATWF